MKPVLKIKQHITAHKTAYIAGASCLVVGAVGGILCSSKTVQIVDSFKLQICSPTTNNVLQQLIPRGHRGNEILCLETGEKFASQNRAAEALGVATSSLSQHLAGKFENAGGLHFKNMGEYLEPRSA